MHAVVGADGHRDARGRAQRRLLLLHPCGRYSAARGVPDTGGPLREPVPRPPPAARARRRAWPGPPRAARRRRAARPPRRARPTDRRRSRRGCGARAPCRDATHAWSSPPAVTCARWATSPRAGPTSARSSASSGTASPTWNGPTAVRRSARRWAPHRARRRGRRPAPARRCPTSSRPRHGRRPPRRVGSTSNRKTSTVRAGRSTSIPSRASSCRRRPPTFTAETIGGTCAIRPVSVEAAARTSSSVDAGHVEGRRHLARGVERRRRRAEHDLADVGLRERGGEAQQPRGPADADDQHTRGVGVERPGVADPPLGEQAPGACRRRRARSTPPACRRRRSRRATVAPRARRRRGRAPRSLAAVVLADGPGTPQRLLDALAGGDRRVGREARARGCASSAPARRSSPAARAGAPPAPPRPPREARPGRRGHGAGRPRRRRR